MVDDRILIFGNGQIGNFYKRYFTEQNYPVSIAQADITKLEDISLAIEAFHPTVVINTAAKTNLEWCANNKLETFHVNVLGADNIAQVCDQKGIYFIHISSGCILESKDEHDANAEDAIPAPISYYSWTKVWAEGMIGFNKSPDFKALILRPRQPVSAQVSAKNMLIKMLTFTRFIDVPNSGTVLEDLMVWTDELMKKRITGVVNAANEGWTTPYEIGLLLQKYILPDMPVIKINKDELNKMTPEKRVDTILDVHKLKTLVHEVKPYQDRLEEIVQQLAQHIAAADRHVLKAEFEKTVAASKQRTIVNDVWEKLLK